MTKFYIVEQYTNYKKVIVPDHANLGAYTCVVKKNGEILYSPIEPLKIELGKKV